MAWIEVPNEEIVIDWADKSGALPESAIILEQSFSGEQKLRSWTRKKRGLGFDVTGHRKKIRVYGVKIPIHIAIAWEGEKQMRESRHSEEDEA